LDQKQIAKKLVRLREELGLTAREVANKVKLSQAQISRLENGKQNFRSKTLVKIAKALGVKPLFFFLDEKDTPATKQVFESAPKYSSKRSPTISKALSYPEFSRLLEQMSESFLIDKRAFLPVANLIQKAIDAPRENRRDAMRILRGKFEAVPKKKKKRQT